MIGEITFPVDPSAPCAAMADCVRRAADLFAGAGSRSSGTARPPFGFVMVKRHYMYEHLPMPKRQRPLPDVLSLAEVQRLLDSACNLYHRAMLMTLYSTGIRRAEMCRLKVSDIDSKRMIAQDSQGHVDGGLFWNRANSWLKKCISFDRGFIWSGEGTTSCERQPTQPLLGQTR